MAQHFLLQGQSKIQADLILELILSQKLKTLWRREQGRLINVILVLKITQILLDVYQM